METDRRDQKEREAQTVKIASVEVSKMSRVFRGPLELAIEFAANY